MSRLMARVFLGAFLMLAFAWPLRAVVSVGTIEEDPNVTRAKLNQKLEDDYKEGMKARAAGDTATAVRLLLNVAEAGKQRSDSPYPEKAFNELKTVVEEARKELQVARELLAGEDPPAGLSELKRITRTYMGLWPAKDAGKLALQLETNPQFQAMLRAGRLAEDLRKAESLEAQAEAILHPSAPKPEPPPPTTTEAAGAPRPPAAPAAAAPPVKPPGGGAVTIRPKELTPQERQAARIERLLEAYEIYSRVVQQGAGTDPAKKAAAARERLEKDADLMKSIRAAQDQRKAREWLNLADNYFRAGRFDTARQYCQKILSALPHTPQAADAQDLLERMK